MIDTQVLRINILNLATSGQLTEGLETDRAVDEIIANLPEPSNKRKKLLEQVFEYDKTFDIPSHWKWVKLGEITSYGDTPCKVMVSDCSDEIWVLELEDIQAGGKLLRKKRVKERKSIGEKTSFKEGQLLYSKLRPYLKKVLIADEDGISTPELIASDVYAGILPQYLLYCLTNSYVDRVINKRSYGIKMPRVDAGFMVNLPIPLPPVEEQQRIVDIVESAFKEIEQIEVLQEGYANNEAILKKKLIDAGIQGKLTEQLSEDGIAEELFAEIQTEKQQLIKEKKIKKEKALADISEEEIPFEIPNNWKWVRLGELISISSGKGLTANQMKDGNIPVFGGNGITGYHNEAIVSHETVVIGRVGFYCGSVHVTPKKAWVTDNAFITEYPEKYIDRDYLVYVLKFMKLGQRNNGAAQPVVSGKKIYPLLFPLPPLNEQKRIATKLNELLEFI